LTADRQNDNVRLSIEITSDSIRLALSRARRTLPTLIKWVWPTQSPE
jgi:hypothetical protein